MSPTNSEEGWNQVRRRLEERGRARARAHLSTASLACQHPLFRESSFLEQNRVTAATIQRCTATLNEFLAFAKMSLEELKLLAKFDEMVVEMLEHMYFQGYCHGAGDYLMAAITFAGSSDSTEYVPGAFLVGCGSSNDGGGNGCERRRVCGDARDPVCGLLEAQRIVQSDSRPGHSFPQRVGRRQLGSPPCSPGRVEDLENRRVRQKRLVGRSSFDRNRQSIDEIHSWESSDDRTLEPISGKVRSSFCQMGRRTRSLMEIQKRGRWSEKSVRRYEKHARLLKENCKIVDSHAKVWATGDKPHAAIARRGTTPSPTSVDQTGSQPRMIFRVALSRQVACDLQTSVTSQSRWSAFLAVGRPCSASW